RHPTRTGCVAIRRKCRTSSRPSLNLASRSPASPSPATSSRSSTPPTFPPRAASACLSRRADLEANHRESVLIYELNHFGIVVRDLEKSLAFYQDLLGAKVVYKGFIPPSKTDVIY